MAEEMAPASQCPLLSHFNRSSSQFHIWIAFIKLSLKFEYEFFATKINQDGQHNGRRLSACISGHLSHLLSDSFQISKNGLLLSNSRPSWNMESVSRMSVNGVLYDCIEVRT